MEKLLKILDEVEKSNELEVDYTQVKRFIDFYNSLKNSTDNQSGFLDEPSFDFNGANIEARFWFFDILECDSSFREMMHYCKKFEAEVQKDDRILLRFLIPGLFKRKGDG